MNTRTLNIALPKELLKNADQLAKKEYRNRSELIREALRLYIQEAQEWKELFFYGKKQGKKLGIKSEADVDRIIADYRLVGGHHHNQALTRRE